jgi:hypothetical protein
VIEFVYFSALLDENGRGYRENQIFEKLNITGLEGP